MGTNRPTESKRELTGELGMTKSDTKRMRARRTLWHRVSVLGEVIDGREHSRKLLRRGQLGDAVVVEERMVWAV